ncbi:hypothetical protein BJ508DRAFT_415821 [Ascobolus immersus RN42]|uniref:Uncharacterized protein n=1 Tax=Ascobolus immersus RN42 TaxID=1160509 RepID=A0A3N4I6E0_ASCIM|nr:hypothetical protein BJ508DRAFT_415821 [Ascobolus immersus RN42]
MRPASLSRPIRRLSSIHTPPPSPVALPHRCFATASRPSVKPRRLVTHHCQQSRPFLSKLFGRKKKSDDDDNDPLITISTLLRSLDEKIGKAPSIPALVAALQQLIATQLLSGEPLVDQNAYAVLRTLQYLRSAELNASEEKDSEHYLSETELRKITDATLGGKEESHAHLAKWVFGELGLRGQKLPADANKLVTVMLNCQKVNEAMEFAMEGRNGKDLDLATWAKILRAHGGVVKDEGQFLKFLGELLEKRPDAEDSPKIAQEVIGFYAGVLKDLAKTKEKVAEYRSKGVPLTTKAYVECIRVAVGGGDLAWGKKLVQELLDSEAGMTREGWDCVLQSSVDLGAGVEEIDAYLDEMQKKADTIGGPAPDINTVNGIVQHFVDIKQPFFAERFIALSQTKWKFEPNQETLSAKIRYRLEAGDLQGANAAYNEVKSRYQITKEESGAEALALLRTFCDKRFDSKAIATLFEDIKDFKIPLDTETISALTMHYVRQEMLEEAIELLRVNSTRLTISQRAALSKLLTAHVISKETSVEAGWAIYNALFQIFPELSSDNRIRIMDEYFSRGRSDMGFSVFDHLHNSPIVGPASSTAFKHCLNGLRESGDDANLKKVYTYFKLSPLEFDTALLNSLMAAFANSSEPEIAIQLFWNKRKIVKGGCNSDTYLIALQATLPISAGGTIEAGKIWRELVSHALRSEDITITKRHLLTFIGTYSRDESKLDDLWSFVRRCRRGKENTHMPLMDAEIMRAIWDVMPFGEPKFEVQYWANHWYPTLWAEVEAGIRKDYEEGKFDTEEEIAAKRSKKKSKQTGPAVQVDSLLNSTENTAKSVSSGRLDRINKEEKLAREGLKITIVEGRRKRVPSNQTRGV